MIQIVAVPQEKIRAEQVGDWMYTNDSIVVYVLETLSPESQLAVAIHELQEAFLCRKKGITDFVVCAFDKQFEDERKNGHHNEDAEPGDDPRAPYREEHQAATFVERAVCAALGINWNNHCNGIIEL